MAGRTDPLPLWCRAALSFRAERIGGRRVEGQPHRRRGPDTAAAAAAAGGAALGPVDGDNDGGPTRGADNGDPLPPIGHHRAPGTGSIGVRLDAAADVAARWSTRARGMTDPPAPPRCAGRRLAAQAQQDAYARRPSARRQRPTVANAAADAADAARSGVFPGFHGSTCPARAPACVPVCVPACLPTHPPSAAADGGQAESCVVRIDAYASAAPCLRRSLHS
ncbi:hypothetical protein CXG81DRAFT_17882 [Caulochytrium protostelioides]|uniref:Uncharacterized protein n=1 Tax=Caulochytrium protostelioides TaxID=1555241 RepID=A0A4P9XAM2_9FUNG|nr:hypothetical protein CXG81DRAFT_17882 [Caulochytrium protostelioides]|eukprot:RKP02433.1 hypothetical protein CXG81DRAFT_17882 [Caulochytrium protostelioides]